MILKIENNDKTGYFYQEAEEIEYHVSSMKEVKSANYDKADWLIREGHEKKDDLPTMVFHLYSSDRSYYRMIITTRTVYIMNNNGKTIERLS